MKPFTKYIKDMVCVRICTCTSMPHYLKHSIQGCAWSCNCFAFVRVSGGLGGTRLQRRVDEHNSKWWVCVLPVLGLLRPSGLPYLVRIIILGDVHWSMCVTCGAWAALHLWDHYTFGAENDSANGTGWCNLQERGGH